MKIAIFGGSFNPVTKAHIQIADFAIKKLNLDKLYFVPNFVSPFRRKDKSIVEAAHRINMLNLSLIDKTEVSDFETKRQGVSYAIETIKYFKRKFPEAEIYLLVGSDHLNKLNKWKSIDELSNVSKITVFKRDKKFSKINLRKYNAMLLDNPIFPGSATQVRGGQFEFISKEVNSYIGKNFLYLNDLTRTILDHKRYKHSTAVAAYATKLAKRNNYDAKVAYAAGMLHDITKCYPKEWHRAFIKKYKMYDEIEDFKLHSLSGYLWSNNRYQVQNEEISNAILRHTSLAKDITMLDKILYAADKLAEGRNFPGIQADRQLIMRDFEEGFKNIVYKTWLFLHQNRGPISNEQSEIYKSITKKVLN